MNKTVKKRIFYGIIVIAWMFLIFIFSNQNGDTSQKTSDSITDRIVEIIIKINSEREYEQLRGVASFIVRKLAHFSIYFIGAIFIFNFVNTFPLKKRNTIFITIIIGIMYAIFDEIHQLFIFGRSAQIRDVLIDSLGIIISTFLTSAMIKNKSEEERWKN